MSRTGLCDGHRCLAVTSAFGSHLKPNSGHLQPGGHHRSAVAISAWWRSQLCIHCSLAVADTIPAMTSRPVPTPKHLSLLSRTSSPQTAAYGEHRSSTVTSPTAPSYPTATDGCWLPKLRAHLRSETTTSTPAATSRPTVPSPLRSRQPCGDPHRRPLPPFPHAPSSVRGCAATGAPPPEPSSSQYLLPGGFGVPVVLDGGQCGQGGEG